MRISEKLVQKINTQIGNEMAAAMQYIQIAAYFDARSLPKFAEFFYAQATEEQEHAMKFLHYLLDVGGISRRPNQRPKVVVERGQPDAVLLVQHEVGQRGGG